jgi:hypothetical protein
MAKDEFEDAPLKDIFEKNKTNTGNLIKAANVEIRGISKISCEDDDVDGIRILLKKDVNDAIKEIKFVCSCGQTKTIILDYNE